MGGAASHRSAITHLYRGPSSALRRFYRTTRDLHLYLGLFVSPILLVYAISVVLLNHAYLPWGGAKDGEAATRTVRVTVPDDDNSLEIAKRIREQLGARPDDYRRGRSRRAPRGGHGDSGECIGG
jgi:hypothetical protein